MSLYVAAVYKVKGEMKLDSSGKYYIIPVEMLEGYAVFNGNQMVSGI